KSKPPNESLRLFVVSENKTKYWPHWIVKNYDEVEKEWHALVTLEQGKSYGVRIIAALVGPAGKALWDFYYKVHDQLGVGGALDSLPPDTIECADVHIKKQS